MSLIDLEKTQLKDKSDNLRKIWFYIEVIQ